MTMNFYIKEWANHTATLMTDNGQVLWTFPSKRDAYEVCREYYAVQFGEDIDLQSEATDQAPIPDLVIC
jgi:hypothetical protein